MSAVVTEDSFIVSVMSLHRVFLQIVLHTGVLPCTAIVYSPKWAHTGLFIGGLTYPIVPMSGEMSTEPTCLEPQVFDVVVFYLVSIL